MKTFCNVFIFNNNKNENFMAIFHFQHLLVINVKTSGNKHFTSSISVCAQAFIYIIFIIADLNPCSLKRIVAGKLKCTLKMEIMGSLKNRINILRVSRIKLQSQINRLNYLTYSPEL